MSNAAILFEPEGYVLAGDRVMGRQAAGNAFLRAAVRVLDPLWAYTPHEGSARAFGELVRALNPAAQPRWVPADQLGTLARIGALYLPHPGLDGPARLRLRIGPAAYSLCGVTHTTASEQAMRTIAGLLSAPVMPWDAMICTSRAVLATVREVLQAELEYLRWRLGPARSPPLPSLPVIPLGVHTDDFAFAEDERQAARQALGIGPDEVVALFVGRLSFHAKAHPHAMYLALQEAQRRTGRKVTLVQCGWYGNDGIRQAFQRGVGTFCPQVRGLFTDGTDAEQRRRSWAAADLFVSLSDNIQETFGLTPIEAMAAGLPVVVTDWDGYKDTVRDGVDGFRIPTWMPPPDLGEGYARGHESGAINYDRYCGETCLTVSLDHRMLAERLGDLVADGDLRRRLGEAGRGRARSVYDWSVVFGQYRDLWRDLGDRRRAAAQDPAEAGHLGQTPRVAANHLDPYRSFAHYPSRQILPATRVRAEAGGVPYDVLKQHGFYVFGNRTLPDVAVVERLFAALADGPLTIADLAGRCGLETGRAVMAVAVLAKMRLVRLDP